MQLRQMPSIHWQIFEPILRQEGDHSPERIRHANAGGVAVRSIFKTNPYMERGLISGILLKPEQAFKEILCPSSSSFDIAKSASGEDEPERFYHGFVLGLMAELSEQFTIRSNRESGFGCYDVMLCPIHKEKDNAYIIEFKVFKPGKEKNLEETVNHALPRWMRNGMGRS